MIDQGRVRANGIDIAYDRAGSGEPVLLIHGLGSSRADWYPQLAALSGYCVVRYDVRGHGESSRPPSGYDVPTLARDAAALIEALGLGAVHVVGLSLGGMIAFQLAVDHPARVRSLTIVNSGPAVVGETAAERRQLALRHLLTWALGPRWLSRILARRLYPKPSQAPLRDDFIARMATNDRRAYLALTRAVLGWSVAARLPEIACPVLVVSGDRDYTTVARKEKYVRALGDARLVVVADSGHATPLDQPEPFNAALVRFLEEQRAATAPSADRGTPRSTAPPRSRA